MYSVGIDLHKKLIVLCILDQARKIVGETRLACSDVRGIRKFFTELGGLGPFQAAIEATASYEWLVKLLEGLADRVVLAHPKRLRVIAESVNKSDKVDARVLATFLALDMLPTAYRPSPREREHRALVRHRDYLMRRVNQTRVKIRAVLAHYNADRKDLFTAEGRAYLAKMKLSSADRFVIDQLLQQWEQTVQLLQAAAQRLREFAKAAPPREREARAILRSIPYVGPVTTDVVLSELGDVRRFRSSKKVVAYAGLAPGQRESGGRRKELGITKEGSRLLRWALIEAAWRLVWHSRYWEAVFERLRARRGAKRAIVAVARRLLTIMYSLLRRGQRWHPAAA